MAKQVVELKDKSTSFHDFEDGFDLVRAQRKELPTPVGRETRRALNSGRHVLVLEPEKKNDQK